jgi:hypothetical protein
VPSAPTIRELSEPPALAFYCPIGAVVNFGLALDRLVRSALEWISECGVDGYSKPPAT